MTVVGTDQGEQGYDLDAEISRWRSHAQRGHAIQDRSVDELEDHLRAEIDDLRDAGLRSDEAFLIAVKRLGGLDELSHQFAREHGERLWKQLVVVGETGDAPGSSPDRHEPMVAVGLAFGVAVAVKALELVGRALDDPDGFYLRNAVLVIFPFLVAYFVWKRGGARLPVMVAGVVGVAAAAIVNLYPFGGQGHTEVLVALHLPIVLWLVVGVAYAGGRWRDHGQRMDFVRFSGEWFVYYVLIGLGGLLLIAFTAGTFGAIGVDTETFIGRWLLPCGAAGAVIIAAWLVEAKQGVIENIAPVLTRLFTPLFSALLLAFLVALIVTRTWIDVDRDILIFFDLLLVMVLGLFLYSLSARSPSAGPGLADWFAMALLVAALAIDVLVLAAIAGRISDFGFSANKSAALGENVLLLVNLGWAARLYLGFLTGRRPFASSLSWQTSYLPALAVWAAVVVVVFPPLFAFD